MPLYLYRCEDCGQEFEKMMRFSEADQKPECPSCSGSNTEKQIAGFAIQGGGFASYGSFGGGSSCGGGGRFT